MEIKNLTIDDNKTTWTHATESQVAIRVDDRTLDLAKDFARSWYVLQRQFEDHALNCFVRNPMCWIITTRMSAHPLCNCAISKVTDE